MVVGGNRGGRRGRHPRTDHDPHRARATKKVFRILDRYERVCITPIDIPEECPTRKKKPLEGVIVWEGF